MASQTVLITTLINWLIERGWTLIYSNKPGEHFRYVVPIQRKIPDIVVIKEEKLLLVQVNTVVKMKYINKLKKMRDYLQKYDNCKKWFSQVKRKIASMCEKSFLADYSPPTFIETAVGFAELDRNIENKIFELKKDGVILLKIYRNSVSQI